MAGLVDSARAFRDSGRRIMSGFCALLLLPLVAVPAAVAIQVAAATPAAAAPVGTKTLHYSATLSTADQAMFGAGTASTPHDISTNLFDKSWNSSGGFDDTTDVSFDPCFGAFGGCSIDFGTYGASFSAQTSGEIGMSSVVHGVTGGSVGVTYPMNLQLSGPADDSFAPGDTVQITTAKPAVQAGAAITSSYPSFSGIEIDGKFGFHASASGSFCVGGCVSGTIFSLDLPGGSGSVASGQLLSLSANDLLMVQGLGLSKCFGIAEGLLFGASTYPNAGHYCENSVTHQDSGYVAFPNVTLGAANAASDGSLAASGSDQYVVLPVSAVAWAAKIADLPFGFPNLNATFDGTGVSYTTLNAIFTAVLSETQNYTFTPRVDLTLDFGQPVAYHVRDASDTVVLTGLSSQASFPLGDTISVTVPNALTVTPSVSMGSATFRNHTFDTVSGYFQLQALSLSASIGGCCDGVFPGIDINLGPVYDSGAVPLASTSFDIYDHQWQLGGFNVARLSPFTLTPDPLPVATAMVVHPVEGAMFSGAVASFVDPDPAAANDTPAADYSASIDWGDGHTTTGVLAGTGAGFTVSGSHTYAEEGTYPVRASVQDLDTANVHSTADSSAVVADAPLTVTGSPTLTSIEGAPTTAHTLVATFTDADPAGTVGDYTASIDWGDNTAPSTGTVTTAAGGAFAVFAPSHTYAEEGIPTVRVTIADTGGASVVGEPTMTTSDAALHATGLTNDTLTGSGTPALLWPGTGNAVLASFTDQDPGGTVSDYAATIDWGDGSSSAGVIGTDHGAFTVTGNHTYADSKLGVHSVTITINDAGGSQTTATTTLLAYGYSSGGSFAISNTALQAATGAGTPVTFWSSQWAQSNRTATGAPAAFKGYIDAAPTMPAPPATVPNATVWNAHPGNAGAPPATVPSYMLVLVTTAVTKSGAAISGDVTHWAVVHTADGYAGNPGHPGVGSVAAVVS